MGSFCPTDMSLGLVANLLGSLDCNVRAFSEAIYRGLSGPGSELSWALTAVLTIYVAVMGLRLMLGTTQLRVSEFSIAALKIGLVLALATEWPVYEQLIFNALFHGPEQIVASAMGASGAALAEPFAALQRGFDELQASAAFFARSPGTAFAGSSLHLVSYMLLFSSLGAVLAAKAVLGLLLALGPVFATLLLLDSTRGIFAGWLKVALGFALVPLIVTLALTAEMILINPYLDSLAQMRAVGQADMALGNAVFVLIFICSGVSLAAIAGIFIVALGFRLPARQVTAPQTVFQQALSAPHADALLPAATSSNVVRILAEAIERRDARFAEQAAMPHRVWERGRSDGHMAVETSFAAAYRHAVRPRQAASSTRRDGP